MNTTYFELSGENYVINLTGCKKKCYSCGESDFDAGSNVNKVIDELLDNMDLNRKYFNNIIVKGGEPLDQKKKKINALLSLLDMSFPDKKIYLYTRYSEAWVEAFAHKSMTYVDAIRVGRCNNIDLYATDEAIQADPLTGFLVSKNQYFIKGRREL